MRHRVIIITTNRLGFAMTVNLHKHDFYKTHSTIYNTTNEATALTLYNKLGGFEAFSSTKLTPDERDLRKAFLSISAFPDTEAEKLFNAIPKLSKFEARAFVAREFFLFNAGYAKRILDADVKSFLWGISKTMTSHHVRDDNHIKDRVPLSVKIHDESLFDRHHTHSSHCWGFRLDSNLTRKLHEESRDWIKDSIGSEVLDILYERVLSSPIFERRGYAGMGIVDSSHWDALRADKREVLNSIAANPFLPEHIAADIVNSHKTPGLRKDIARYSTSKAVLDLIWNSTKSKDIRLAVAQNTVADREEEYINMLLDDTFVLVND